MGPALAIGGWLAVMALARVVGLAYVRAHDTPLAVGAVPFVGRWGFHPETFGYLAVAALVGAACVWWLPAIAARASWRTVLLAAAGATVAFSLALAWAGPVRERTVSIEYSYGQHTELVDEAGVASYLDTFVAVQPTLPGHLRAHPPGMVLGLWSFEQVGLSGTGWQLALALAAGGASVLAVLVAFREVAGERLARGAAPFVALAPLVVWHTNADVIFGALALTGVSMVVVATGRRGTRRDLLAVGGGLVFAVALFCSYGSLLLVLPALVVGWQRRAVRALAAAAGGAAVGLLTPYLWGFWWPAGLFETRIQYENSLSRVRGYKYWLLGNPATFLGLIGPATLLGLARLRGAGARGLVFGGLACVFVSGLSGMTSAETERIWQPFAPLVVLAGAALWAHRDRFDITAARRWLGLQVGIALAFQATLRTLW